MNQALLFHVWLEALGETLIVVSKGIKDDKIVISSREKRGMVIIVLQVILFQYLLHTGNLVYFIT